MVRIWSQPPETPAARLAADHWIALSANASLGLISGRSIAIGIAFITD